MLDKIELLFEAKQNKAALTLLRQYVQANQNDASQSYRLAVVEEEIGEKSLADLAYQHCLKTIEHNVLVYLYAGCFYLKQGQFEQGVSILSLGVDLDARLTQFQFDEQTSYETRVRSYNADLALRHHFSLLHQNKLNEFIDIEHVKNSVWPQTHNAQFKYKHEKQLPHLFYLPELTATAIWKSEQFSWAAQVKEQFESIKLEYLSLNTRVQEQYLPYLDESYTQKEFEALAGKQNWTALHIYKDGKINHDIEAYFPKTLAILARLPLYGLGQHPFEVFFSVLKAGQHITPHYGLSNHSLTVHLPIIIPGDGYLSVSGEQHHWQQGEPVVFDDSFEHEAINLSDKDRVVLIFSIWHPELNDNEKLAIQQSFNARNQWLLKRTSYLPAK
ncbi:aspartyl/asparaginyl beta-hydroxylase domain-containing protein [Thalassotalea atypica]|uniref:aspartyl/asparaginyl beta-hydroxylase domain-containing protein n=1 Tax=Thalassotalea atypica TaxID=2054316 RepID=UPI0025725BBD|nr:aspartyl/asparaginyl beta-hydroxylase domain-containing protein [Thalassotalea atypica]